MTPSETFPLSPLQHGMLLAALADPRGGTDVEQLVGTLREALAPDLLRAAWERVAERHAVLRTAFRWEGEPAQVVAPRAPLSFSHEDWRALDPETQDERLGAFLRADRRRGFAMDQPPLQRVTLFRCGEDEWRMVWSFHHALLDGRSFAIVLREVFAIYEALRRGEEPALPAPPRPFREHVEWLAGQDFTASESFWREGLAGFSAPTPLVVERLPGANLAEPDGAPGEAELSLSTESTASLRTFAAGQGVTLNTLVQGAWALRLARYSGEEDVVFGATRACRRSSVPGAEAMVGLLINTVPMRVRAAAGAPLGEWLRGLRAQWIAMRAHEHTPLALVQGWSSVPGGCALFESLVVFEDRELNETPGAESGAWKGRSFTLHEKTGYALTLAAYGGAVLRLKLGYDAARFDLATIRRMLGHLQTLLTAMPAGDPARPIGELPLVSAEERRQLLAAALSTEPAPAAPERTLHALFAAQAARTPDAIAVSGADGEALTYRELDRRASLLAAHLRALGVGPEVLAGLRMERTPALVVALLAILKSGGAYLPIDLAYPPERAAFMLADAAAPVLVTERPLAAALPAGSARVVCVDEFSFTGEPAPFPDPATPDSLVYAIYTSGSTGQPKGCLVTHRNVVRLFSSTAPWFCFGPHDAWTLFHSVAFDFSVWEIWGALLHGGRLVVVPPAVSRSPTDFHALLAREGVSVLNQTPSAFRQLIAAENSQLSTLNSQLSLRLVIFGGEALDPAMLRPWWERHGDQHPQLVNMYGITETTVHVTYRPLRAAELGGGSVIGEPIPDLQLYVLDSALRPVPIGVPGELFVGGAGLARGYLGRPELTAERFLSHPFSTEPATRLYRTGDLARRLPDEDLEYLGRIDQQVKIRGFRIELGEIEAVLANHAAVREAAVSARTDDGDTRLAAYFVADAPIGIADLRAHLKSRLPDYMIPAAFIPLERLPLTPHGKLDRRALPAPNAFPDEPAAPPRTALEQAIAAVWSELLRIPAVGLDDNFFDLGGHSLLLLQLHSRLHPLGGDLALTELFQYPTVRALAARLAQNAAPDHDAARAIRDRAGRQRAALQAQARHRLSSAP